jgi:hypothetical protein
MLKSGRLRTSLAEALLIVVSVFLALAAEDWRQDAKDREVERDYLAAIAEGLRSDTAEIQAVIEYSSRRTVYTRLVLESVLSGEPPENPQDFLIGIEASSRYLAPGLARDAYDDLLGSGQLNLIRNSRLRRQATSYYRIPNEPAWELWRNRVWYQFGPVAVDVMPFEAQEWAASFLGAERLLDQVPEDVPIPANLPRLAETVADRLRAVTGIEGLINAVMRSNANQSRLLRVQKDMAADLLAAVEAELARR